MIKLKSITGYGFMSFLDEFSFSLEDFEGKTVQIDGLNLDDQMASSNGSGKSTLLEAIFWLIYGTTLRKLRYNTDVINTNSKEAMVSGLFDINETEVHILRSVNRKVQKLEIIVGGEEFLPKATKTDKQKGLIEIIGFMEVSEFLASTLFSEDTQSFPDMAPSERSKFIRSVGNTERFESARRKAAIMSRRSSDSLRTLSAVQERQEEEENQVKRRIERETERANSLESQIDREIDRLRTQYEDQKEQNLERIQEEQKKVESLEEEKDQLAGELEAFLIRRDSRIAEINSKTEDLVIKVRKTREKAEALTSSVANEIMELTLERASLETELDSLVNRGIETRKQINALEIYEENECFFCGQKATKQAINKQIKKLKKEVESLAEEGERITEEKAEITEAIESLKEKKEEIQNRFRARRAKLDEKIEKNREERRALESLREDTKIRELIRDVENEMFRANNEIVRLRRNIEREQASTESAIQRNEQIKTNNTHRQAAEEEKQNLRELRSEIKRIKDLVSKSREMRFTGDFWSMGFKKIQFQVMDSLVEQIENRAREILSDYTSSIDLSIETIRETQQGVERDEINIVITDQEGTEREFLSFSGGERQKVKMAIALGISQVVEERASNGFNFVAFDEPNAGLDDVGRECNYQSMSKIAQNTGKVVLATDHDAYFSNLFDERITVQKENGNSSIA